MGKVVVLIFLLFAVFAVNKAHAEIHVLIGVKEEGFLYKNTGKLLNAGQLKDIASSTKIDRVTLVVDKCIAPLHSRNAFIALSGLGIDMISIQLNPKDRDIECKGT